VTEPTGSLLSGCCAGAAIINLTGPGEASESEGAKKETHKAHNVVVVN
jgi:hypothetical protein